MTLKVLVLIITFNPDLALLKRGLESVRVLNQIVYVFDNASSNRDLIRELSHSLGYLFIANSVNLGVASAINQGLMLAKRHGAEWLWTFDQDTEIFPGAFDAMKAAVLQLPPVHHIAILVMAHQDRRTGDGYDKVLMKTDIEGCSKVRSAISSGSLVSVSAANAVGGFDERLFIDFVDLEFCLRCRSKGWGILLVHDSIASHSLGDIRTHNVLGLTLHSTNHNALRRYYLVRNTFTTVSRHFFVDVRFSVRCVAILVANAIAIVLFEDNKWRKLQGMYFGFLDFLIGISGTIPEKYSKKLNGV